MHATDRAVTVVDCPYVLCNTDSGTWVKRWMHCGGRGMSISRCIGCKVDCPTVSCYEEVEQKKNMSKTLPRFDGQPLLEPGPSFAVLRCLFSPLHFAQCFGYWAYRCHYELHLPHQTCWIFAPCYSIELFAILPLNHMSHYLETPGWRRELQGSRLFCIAVPPVFVYYSSQILNHHSRQDLAWRIATS